MDEALVLRYLKVRALAERGSAGERDNAARVMAKLEADHPGLGRYAEEYLRMKDKEMRGEHASPHPSEVRPERSPFVGNWENIFRFAQAAFTGASGFAETVVQAAKGRELAKAVQSTVKMSKTNEHLVVALRMPVGVFDRARRLSPAARAAFRQTLHDLLDRQMDEIFD